MVVKKVEPIKCWERYGEVLREEKKRYGDRKLLQRYHDHPNYPQEMYQDKLLLTGEEAEEYNRVMRAIVDKRDARATRQKEKAKERTVQAIKNHKLIKFGDDVFSGDFGGMFKKTYLTEEGKRVLEQMDKFLGSKHKWRGCSKTTVFFKWVIKEDQKELAQVARDWLIDEGYEVKLAFTNGQFTRPRRKSDPDNYPETSSNRITVEADYAKYTFYF